MKTTEFIKRVEELGLSVKEGVGYEIYHAGKIVSRVFKMHESVVDTSLSEFRYLNNRDRMDLLDLIIEYAKTPLEDREEEKKYKVRCKLTNRYLDKTFNGKLDWNSIRTSQRIFTLKELEDLGINPEHYDLEEVE